MNPNEIERWALRVIENVLAGQPNEDNRVELKSTWLEAKEMARHLAGHANASHGTPILWLFGVNEKQQKIIGVESIEVSNWYAQVEKCFDDNIAPIPTIINVPYETKTVVAIYFETYRIPFIVKNPDGQGKIQREVPWREKNSIRSARRRDILKILDIVTGVPEIEIVSARVRRNLKLQDVFVEFYIYLIPKSREMITIPFHRCSITLKSDNDEELRILGIKMSGMTKSNRVWSSDFEIYTDVPCLIQVMCELKNTPLIKSNGVIWLNVMLQPAGIATPVVLQTPLKFLQVQGNHEYWGWHDDFFNLQISPGVFL